MSDLDPNAIITKATKIIRTQTDLIKLLKEVIDQKDKTILAQKEIIDYQEKIINVLEAR